MLEKNRRNNAFSLAGEGGGGSAKASALSALPEQKVDDEMKQIAAQRPIIYDNCDVPQRGEALSPIIWQGRQWAVTTYGLERRDGSYFVDAERLNKDLRAPSPYSWVAHIADTKTAVDLEDLTTAFLIACAVHRVSLSKADVDVVLDHFATRRLAKMRKLIASVSNVPRHPPED